MKALLAADAGQYTWVAAAVGSQQASGYQLATGDPVMAVGGFNGTDPSPTLEQFSSMWPTARSTTSSAVAVPAAVSAARAATARSPPWVEEHFTAMTVGDVTLYDLSGVTR